MLATPVLTEILSFCYLLFFPYLFVSWFYYAGRGLPLLRKLMAGLFTIYGLGFLGSLADKARRPEWILGQGDEAAGTAFAETGDVLTGLAGSPAVAEGPVFLVLTPEDFAIFPKGAVLVARTTHPTWTPLFYSAAAVVTESGGPLSHGAVTAREVRIPAVMSVKESLTRLHNGQRVRVDGAAGRVELLI